MSNAPHRTLPLLLASWLMAGYPLAQADDTDIFFTTDDNIDRKILVIFDNSGSMAEKNAQGQSKMKMAKQAFTSIIDDNPIVKFGLEIFNTDDGGYTPFALPKTMTAADRTSLKKTVNDLSPETWTPLAETLMESYLYLGGHEIKFGGSSVLAAKQDKTHYKTPLTDNVPGPKSCEQMNAIILMTDGQPTKDQDQDAAIQKLPNFPNPQCAGKGDNDGSCLNDLAGWMATHNVMVKGHGDPATDPMAVGAHTLTTHTIGFQITSDLLKYTAQAGGGLYFEANAVDDLRKAFQMAISSVISTPATLAPPAIPVDSQQPTRTLKEIYIPLVAPQKSAFWPGNLKKFLLNDQGEVVGADGKLALDPVTGQILATAKTAWGDASGNAVEAGGVGAKINPATRQLYSTFKGANGKPEAGDFDWFGAKDAAQMNEYLKWAQGYEFDLIKGVATNQPRWALGDILHSAPLVINYGNNEVKVLVGTNDGFMHLFDGKTGNESWAFYPKELGKNFQWLIDPANPHRYGVDGSAVAYINDFDGNQQLTDKDDEVWTFFGLGRGGRSYYALDIQNPDQPQYQWTINETIPGFLELGQTWSTPAIGWVPTEKGKQLALIVAGGYDPNKDLPGVGTKDSQGRGIFITDAKNGQSLIRGFSAQAKQPNNQLIADLTDSMPAPVATLDSNGDGIIDRIYVGDTAANIWRMDLVGGDSTQWTVFKFASLGREDPDSKGIVDDRRIFNQIDIVKTRQQGLAYDALLVGTGNRSALNDTAVNDRFYMLRDYSLTPALHLANLAKCPKNLVCQQTPAPITHKNLFNVTDNVIQDGTVAQQQAAKADLYATDPKTRHAGWYLNLEPGEKSLGVSTTVQGTVYFTAYTPPSAEDTLEAKKQCRGAEGKSYLWAVSLHDGRAVHADWDDNDSLLSVTDRKLLLSLGGGPKSGLASQYGDGGILLNAPNTVKTGSSLRTGGIYWYQGEAH